MVMGWGELHLEASRANQPNAPLHGCPQTALTHHPPTWREQADERAPRLGLCPRALHVEWLHVQEAESSSESEGAWPV